MSRAPYFRWKGGGRVIIVRGLVTRLWFDANQGAASIVTDFYSNRFIDEVQVRLISERLHGGQSSHRRQQVGKSRGQLCTVCASPVLLSRSIARVSRRSFQVVYQFFLLKYYYLFRA